MPPSPVRKYRSKSRLRALDADRSANLREQALDLAQKGLTRRGPVHEGSPQAQKRSADRLGGEKREQRNQRMKVGVMREGETRTNTTSNARAGQRFKVLHLRAGKKVGDIHSYENGKRVFVPKKRESGGTGNYHSELGDIATQRERIRRGKRSGKRAFMSVATRDTGRRDYIYRQLRPVRGLGRLRARK